MSYLCVDGGQTKTAVALLDENGAEMEAWGGGPPPPPSKPGAMENLRAVARGIGEELRGRLAGSGDAPPEAACFSLTGFLQGEDSIPSLIREEMERAIPDLGKVRAIPDYVGNWAAATRGEPGVVVISGGGSVAYGRNASGDALRVGGWGHLLGDEGSGYWIGLQAIKAALKSRAGVIPKTAIEARVMDAFETDDDRQLLRQVYSGSFPEARVPTFVQLVAELAREGDGRAEGILDEAAGHLAGMAQAVRDAIGEDLPVHPSGGVFRAPTMRERFVKALTERGPDGPGRDARVAETAAPNPLEGAFFVLKQDLM